MCDNTNFEQLCRICSEKSEGINVFSEDGVSYNLVIKIKNYLNIQVLKEDPLPKIICEICRTKLENHYKFASMALKTQDKLNMLFHHQGHPSTSKISLDKQNDFDDHDIEEDEESGDENDENDEEDESEEESETDHSGSLLHSILTHGRKCTNEDQGLSLSEVTEVEVRIDPMLFLSGNEDNSSDMMDESAENNVSSGIPQSSKDVSIGWLDTKESKPYQCTVCPRGFHSEISLQNHLWSHLSRKVLSNNGLNSKLRLYEKASVYSSNGVLHTVGDMPVSHPYLCPICGRHISTKGNLKVHLETHRPKGKYTCDICGRIFKTQSNLYRHKEYHGGDQFTCDVCARVYPTKSTLRAHSITHSDLRPHQCPLCEKTFKRNQDLKFHINQHTGARPYKCPFCPKAFASSGNCFSHRKRMHPNELEKYKEMANGYVQ